MWLTISSVLWLVLPAPAAEQAPSDPDPMYAVVGNGLPIPLSEARDRIARLPENVAVHLLERSGSSLKTLGWYMKSDLLDVFLSSENPAEVNQESDFSPLDAYVDRKSPVVEFEWSGPSVQSGNQLRVRPDSRLALRFSDDSGIDSWKAVLEQSGSVPDARWAAGENRLIIFAVDQAGNPGRAGEIAFNVDGEPPRIECRSSEDGQHSNAGKTYYRLPLDLSCTVEDDSGVAAQHYRTGSDWIALPEGEFTIESAQLTVSAMDRLNQRRTQHLSWPTDDTAPEINLSLPDGGEITDDDVHIKPGDRIRIEVADSGVGIKQARYRYNDQPETDLPDSIRFVDRGWYLLEVTAEDHFGHVTVAEWTVRAGAPRSQRPRKP